MPYRFMQSRACPAILAVFLENGEGIKLTMSGEKPWGCVPESKPGTTIDANEQCWIDIDESRKSEAKAALYRVMYN